MRTLVDLPGRTERFVIPGLTWFLVFVVHALLTCSLAAYGMLMLGAPGWFIDALASVLLFPELCLRCVDLGFFDATAGRDTSWAIIQNSLCWVACAFVVWMIGKRCFRLFVRLLSPTKIATHC
jgi:hypothetical protein